MTIPLSKSGAFSNLINVNSLAYSADNTGVADSTTAFQTAANAAAGKTLYVPAGNWRLSAPVVLSPNTRVFGQGKATRIFTTAGTGHGFFVNSNLNTYGDTSTGNYGVAFDSGIVIEDMYFDYGSLNDGHTHAIGYRFAQNCVVQRCWFNGGNDATAFLASKNMTVRDCVAIGNNNVAFDHWDGVENCLVENNTITMFTATSTNDNAGIMFSAANTGAVARTTKGCIARGNAIYNAGVGIFINQLDTQANSKTVACIVADNVFYTCLGAIYVTGNGYGHQVLNNYVEGGGGTSTGGSLVRIAGEAGTPNPSACIVRGNVANGFVGVGANIGLMPISGLRHTLGDLTLLNGSGIAGGTTYYISTAASGCVLEGSQILDAASITATSFGLFQGNNNAVADTNCTIRCWDGYASNYRRQGGSDTFTTAPTILSNTAVPAGGTTGSGLKLSSVANFGVFFGSGVPTLSAAKGSLYLRSDGTTTNDRMYVNTNGSTTWTNVTTAA